MLLHFVFAQIYCFALVIAQDFSVPPGWREPTSNLSREDRAIISQALLDTMTPMFNDSSGLIDALTFTQSANMVCAIAFHDLIAGTTTNEAAVSKHLQTVTSVTAPGFFTDFVNEPVNWALAVIYAYRAYGDPNLLSLASSVWDRISIYMVTPANAARGTHPLKNGTFLSQCDGASNAGGVFYLANKATDTSVNGATVGGFMVLSPYLFEATKNETYAAAAELSAQIIYSHLYNGTIVVDGISLSSCSRGTIIVTDNSGFYIEGLSVYANVTQNGTWTSLLNSLISTTVPFPFWTGANGIITEVGTDNILSNTDGPGFKSIFIRGLYEAWSRSPTDSPVANLIHSYMMVQYNALLDLASNPGSNRYSPAWFGPAVPELLPWGQLAAIDVLNSALGMSSNSPTSPVSNDPIGPSLLPTATPTPSRFCSGICRHHSSPKTSVIVSATIAGCIGVLLILTALVVLIRRRRRRQRTAINQEMQNAQLHSYPWHNAQVMAQVPGSAPPAYVPRELIVGNTASNPSTNPPAVEGFGQVPNFNLRPLIIPPRKAASSTTVTSQATITASSALQSQSSGIRESYVEEGGDAIRRDDLVALTRLVQNLTSMVEVLPSREISVDETAPPRYE